MTRRSSGSDDVEEVKRVQRGRGDQVGRAMSRRLSDSGEGEEVERVG